MRIFKTFHIHLLALFLVGFVACEDYTSVNIEEPAPEVQKYVAVGNSLTAGFQSGALYEEAQQNSFANMLARQMRIDDFEQPLVSSPGFIPGRLELANFETSSIVPNSGSGQPLNSNLARPYDNLGIPGAVLVDYLNPNGSGQLQQRATNQQDPRFNPYYGLVLRNQIQETNPNIHNVVSQLSPDLVTFWLGNNDVLGFVIDGGDRKDGRSITPPAIFEQLYQASAQALGSLDTKVALLNIPNVVTIPYVFLTNGLLQERGVIRDNNGIMELLVDPANQVYLPMYIDDNGTTRQMLSGDLLLFTAQEFFAGIQAGTQAPPVDVNQDGTPEAVIPDGLVLDGPDTNLPDGDGTSELFQAVAAVTQYNAIIEQVASSNDNFILVDVNATFSEIFNRFGNDQAPYTDEQGEVLQPVPGELFSFDGIHPANKGHAIVANLIIDRLNAEFGYNIPKVFVAGTPLGIVLSDSIN